MVKVVLKNLTPNLRQYSDAGGATPHLGIAVAGNAETDALKIAQLLHCKKDVESGIKQKHVTLLATFASETRTVSFDEAVLLLTPPKEVAPLGFSSTPPGEEVA